MRLSLRTASESLAAHQAEKTLTLDRVSARYGNVQALTDVSFSVSRGEIVSLLGPSGSGKSTLLRLVAGIDAPASGRIAIQGSEVAGQGVFTEPEHRHVGMVFQDFALFPHLTVADNVAFGLKGRRRAEARHLVDTLLERLGLRRFAASYPHMLSGGERQRVALARAIAPGPRVLLMDEPFSSLDVRLREDVRRYTVDLLRETGTTTLIVTHDPEEAMAVGDRIAVLNAGRLMQFGSPDEIYSQPTSLFAAQLFGDVNVIPGTCKHGHIETPLGQFVAPHIRDGMAAVCIRPEHLRVATHPTTVHGRVVDVGFLGEVEAVRLMIPGLETPLKLRAFGRTGLRPGEHTAVEVAPGHALFLPHESSDASSVR